jgi:hypothetical protein
MFTLHQEEYPLSENNLINEHYQIITRALGIVAQHPELGQSTEIGRFLARKKLLERPKDFLHLIHSYKPLESVYPQFKKSLEILEKLAPTKENLQSLEALKQRINQLKSSLGDKKTGIQQDIENAKSIFYKNNESYVLLLAAGDDQAIEKIDQENLNIKNVIDLYSKKLSQLELNATFVLNAQESLLNYIINRLVTNYGKAKLNSLLFEYEQGKKEFLTICSKLVKYDGHIFFENHVLAGFTTKSNLFQELELDIKKLSTINRQELAKELLNAA